MLLEGKEKTYRVKKRKKRCIWRINQNEKFSLESLHLNACVCIWFLNNTFGNTVFFPKKSLKHKAANERFNGGKRFLTR